MMRSTVPATLALIAVASCRLDAQQPVDRFWVQERPYGAQVTGVAVHGDSVLFGTSWNRDSTAWMFDRRTRTFARVHSSFDSQVPELGDDFLITASLHLTFAELPEGNRTRVLRTGGRIIALRGPRIAAEQQWRVRHGLTATPAPPDTVDPEPDASRARDWQPIDVRAVAVDTHAVWLGLARDDDYGEFAFGGLLRVDRRSGRVDVIADSLLRDANVESIVPWHGKYLMLLSASRFAGQSAMASFDPATRRARRIPLPSDMTPVQFQLSGDTAWIAAVDDIAALDLRTNALARRGFRLALHGDSVVYELADRTRPPPLQLLAAIGLADELRSPRVAAFARAAMNVITVDGYLYYDPGDRTNVTVDRDSTVTDAEILANPSVMLSIRGIDAPSLRPFLYDALREPRAPQLGYVTALLVSARDTASVPSLRAGLNAVSASISDSSYSPFGAYNATQALSLAWSLAALGNSTGINWLHSVGGIPGPPTLPRISQRMRRDTNFVAGAYEVMVQLHDSLVIPILLARMRDSADQQWALANLLEYGTAESWRAAVLAMTPAPTRGAAWYLFDRVLRDSTGLADDAVIRDSVRALAQRYLDTPGADLEGAARLVLERYAKGRPRPRGAPPSI